MSKKGFNPYKVLNFILKYKGIKDVCIFGTSEEINKYVPNSQVKEVIDGLEEFGYSSWDSEENPYNINVFEPYNSKHELNIPLIKYIMAGADKLVFIGCPHDFIKKVKFNEQEWYSTVHLFHYMNSNAYGKMPKIKEEFEMDKIITLEEKNENGKQSKEV